MRLRRKNCSRSICLPAIATIALLSLALLVSQQSALSQDAADTAKDSSTEINVKNADLAAVIRIFSKKTKRNYILDERVKGKVSIFLPGKVLTEEAITILDSVLALKGFTAVPIGDNIWKIIPSKEARQTTIPTVSKIKGRGSPSVVTRLINLTYVSADDVKQLLTPLISPHGLLNAYTGTNALILIDSEDNIVRLEKIINSLDIPFTDREMTLIPVEHADATELAEKINNLLGESQGKDQKSSRAQALDFARSSQLRDSIKSRTNRATPLGKASAVTVSARSREPKIIADQRTNSIIVVADEDSTARVRALVSQLDSPVDLSGNRFYVYRCQHASAEELADVLSGLAGGSSNTSRSSSSSSSRSSLSRTERSESRLSSQRRTPGRPRNTNQQRAGATSLNLGEDISITADPATNSLIISSNRSDFEKIKALLKDLDIKRKQVLVEAVILEVAIEDDVNLGTEFRASTGGADGGVLASSNFGSLTDLFTNPTQLSEFSLAAASSGSLTLPGGITIPSQTMLITAAQNNSNVNVLSSPTILTTDNEEAEIVVGQNVPFLASTSTSSENLNNTFNQIDRQDVGITLRLTPQISSSNFVTLQLFTEVSNIIPGTLGSDLGPTTTIRTSETTVITKNGQMVVTGGLISDDITETTRGIPFLMDVPLLGFMFKVTRETQQQKNLLIFITPRILDDQFDARDQTIVKRNSMKNVMSHYEISPDRSEVLNSIDIDHVIESQSHSGEKPSTILAPKKKTPPVKHQSGGARPNETLELKVSPRFPALPEVPDASLDTPSGKSNTANMALSAAPYRQAPERKGQYVILQAPGKSRLPDNLPFELKNDSRMLGLIIPEGSAGHVKNFFAAGDLYTYNSKGNPLEMRVLGIFGSAKEAQDFYQTPEQSWYTLSPYEILNIGKGPWGKK